MIVLSILITVFFHIKKLNYSNKFLGGRFDEHFVLRELFSLHIIPKVNQSANKIYEMVKISAIYQKLQNFHK